MSEALPASLSISSTGKLFAGLFCVLSFVLPTAASPQNVVGAWSASGTYNVNDVVTYGGGTYIDIVPTAPVTTTTTTGGVTNYFDQSTIVESQVVLATNGQLNSIGGFESSGYLNVAGATSFVTNVQIAIFDPYGVAFYDAGKNFLKGSLLGGNGYNAPGVPVPVPAGASFVRFWWQDGNMGTSFSAAILDTGTVLQATYTPFGVVVGGVTVTTTVPAALPTDTTHWAAYTTTTTTTTSAPGGSTGTAPWAGKKIFVLGDSIVWANQPVVGQIAAALGAVPSSNGANGPGIDAFPGRTFATFMNGQSNTGAYLPVSASVIADVDLMIIALGTNQDSPYGLGSVTDTPSLSGTMSAQMKSVLETILSWKPGMRIIVVGPYQSNRFNVQAGLNGLLGQYDYPGSVANAGSIAVLQGINTQMKAVAALYAIPYVDMFDESGVNFSTSAIWLKDGLHPSALGYSTFYVPYIVAQMNRYSY